MGPGDVGAIAGACAVAGFLIDRAIHPARHISKRLDEFLADWNGKPERRTPDGASVLHEREPGMPERVRNVEGSIAEIKRLVNGGGLGAQMTAVENKLDQHMAGADELTETVLAEQASLRNDLTDAVRVVTAGQDRLGERVTEVEKVISGRLFPLEEAERAHRAALHEVGLPVEGPQFGDD